MKIHRTFIAAACISIALISSADAQLLGRGAFGFGLSAGGNMMQSNWKTKDPGYGAAIDLSYSLGHHWGLASSLGFDEYKGQNWSNQNVLSTTIHGSLGLSYAFLPDKHLNPFIFAGPGIVYYRPRIDNGAVILDGKVKTWEFALMGGVGFDYYLSESWSVIVTGEAGLMGNDIVDGYAGGKGNDILQRVSIGVRYYLFDRSTVEKILEAVRK